MGKEITQLGVPILGTGFNQDWQLPVTGEGVVSRTNRMKKQIKKESQRQSAIKRWEPIANSASVWAKEKVQNIHNTNVQNTKQRKKAVNRNSEIAKLQEELFQKGYYGSGVSYKEVVDGIMGGGRKLRLLQIKEIALRELLLY